MSGVDSMARQRQGRAGNVPSPIFLALVTVGLVLVYGWIGPSSLPPSSINSNARFFTSTTPAPALPPPPPPPPLPPYTHAGKKERPHIVFVLADDLGQADVGWWPYPSINRDHVPSSIPDGYTEQELRCGVWVCVCVVCACVCVCVCVCVCCGSTATPSRCLVLCCRFIWSTPLFPRSAMKAANAEGMNIPLPWGLKEGTVLSVSFCRRQHSLELEE
jgi:hypothetical protein